MITRKKWLEILKENEVDISLWDFKVTKEWGIISQSEIWGYKKTDTGNPKQIANGKVSVDGAEFWYKSDEYFDYLKNNEYTNIKRLYDVKYYRQGTVLTESDYDYCMENKDSDIAKTHIKSVFS